MICILREKSWLWTQWLPLLMSSGITGDSTVHIYQLSAFVLFFWCFVMEQAVLKYANVSFNANSLPSMNVLQGHFLWRMLNLHEMKWHLLERRPVLNFKNILSHGISFVFVIWTCNLLVKLVWRFVLGLIFTSSQSSLSLDAVWVVVPNQWLREGGHPQSLYHKKEKKASRFSQNMTKLPNMNLLSGKSGSWSEALTSVSDFWPSMLLLLPSCWLLYCHCLSRYSALQKKDDFISFWMVSCLSLQLRPCDRKRTKHLQDWFSDRGRDSRSARLLFLTKTSFFFFLKLCSLKRSFSFF